MSTMSSTLLLTWSALAVSSAFAAQADVPAPVSVPAAAAAPLADPVQQVIVTAQKRAQTTIDVAQSVSVIGGDTLDKQQAATFSDYLKLVPSLQLVQSTPGEGRLVMRGLDTGGVASTVAVYMDETPFGSSSGLVNGAALAGDFDTFDMSRIEVLRGPQGALYGASSLGGLLKFVTNLPDTEKLAVRARVGVSRTRGGDLSHKTNLMVNAPISDTLAFRVSGSYRKDGGFIDSIGTEGSDVDDNINGARTYGARASLLYTPSKDFSVRLSALTQNIDTDASTVVESDTDTLAPRFGRATLSQYVPQSHVVKYQVYNATVNWTLGVGTLTSSTSYSTQKQTFRDDNSYNLSPLVEGAFGTPNELYLAQNTDLEKLTQEVRLASNGGGRFDWLVGAYFTDEEGDIRQRYGAVVPGTLTLITTLPKLAEVALPSTYRESAVFANTTAHLSERFDIDLGLRYGRNKQTARQVTDGALAGGESDVSAASSEHVFTYAIAPKIKFDARTSVYARMAKGYRPGGPNILPPDAPAGTPADYKSDSVKSYELGYKALSADGVFSVDVAAYHIKWSDIQLLAQVNGYGVNTNGVGAISDGVEAALTWRPNRAWRVAANLAYNNARLDGSTSELVGGVKGDKLPFSPKFTVGATADYRFTLNDTTPAYAGIAGRHLARQWGAFDPDYRTLNGRQRQIDAYNVIDVHAGVELGSWTLEAYAKNVGDSKGTTSTAPVMANGANVAPGGAMLAGVISPRTIGFTLTKEY